MNKKSKLIASLAILAAFSLSACNTIQGVGQDLESAGDKAEEVTKKD